MVRGAGAALATLALLAFAGPTAAATPKICNATPQKIYGDLADNGRLDRHYCASDINRALHSPSLQRYEARTRATKPAPPVPPPATEDARSVPFSGNDLALLGGVVVPLLLIGATLGRVTRVRTAQGELRQ
jgi:anti-sigma factor RsiW